MTACSVGVVAEAAEQAEEDGEEGEEAAQAWFRREEEGPSQQGVMQTCLHSDTARITALAAAFVPP